jgi:alpha-amylase/alpha-mannosidase (GH57 family)
MLVDSVVSQSKMVKLLNYPVVVNMKGLEDEKDFTSCFIYQMLEELVRVKGYKDKLFLCSGFKISYKLSLVCQPTFYLIQNVNFPTAHGQIYNQ